MASERFILTLGKVLIAVAWADGDITQSEINTVKELLSRMREVTAKDWSQLEIYLSHPVSGEDRRRLISMLTAQIAWPSDKALALRLLKEMLDRGGKDVPAQREAIEHLQRAINGVIPIPLNVIIGFFKMLFVGAPAREKQLREFWENRIHYCVIHRLEEDGAQSELSDEDLRRLCLAAGLLVQVASVDNDITSEERRCVANTLCEMKDIGGMLASIITDAAATEFENGLDPFRLQQQMLAVTDHSGRLEFLDRLFSVAAADGEVSHDEVETIRQISQGLKIGHREFIQGKLQVSSGQ